VSEVPTHLIAANKFLDFSATPIHPTLGITKILSGVQGRRVGLGRRRAGEEVSNVGC
jgi:hypothetical protein